MLVSTKGAISFKGYTRPSPHLQATASKDHNFPPAMVFHSTLASILAVALSALLVLAQDDGGDLSASLDTCGADADCGGDLKCRRANDGDERCLAEAGPGAPCGTSDFADRFCGEGLFCDTDLSLCVEESFAALGETCGADKDSQFKRCAENEGGEVGCFWRPSVPPLEDGRRGKKICSGLRNALDRELGESCDFFSDNVFRRCKPPASSSTGEERLPVTCVDEKCVRKAELSLGNPCGLDDGLVCRAGLECVDVYVSNTFGFRGMRKSCVYLELKAGDKCINGQSNLFQQCDANERLVCKVSDRRTKFPQYSCFKEVGEGEACSTWDASFGNSFDGKLFSACRGKDNFFKGGELSCVNNVCVPL